MNYYKSTWKTKEEERIDRELKILMLCLLNFGILVVYFIPEVLTLII